MIITCMSYSEHVNIIICICQLQLLKFPFITVLYRYRFWFPNAYQTSRYTRVAELIRRMLRDNKHDNASRNQWPDTAWIQQRFFLFLPRDHQVSRAITSWPNTCEISREPVTSPSLFNSISRRTQEKERRMIAIVLHRILRWQEKKGVG